MEHLKEHFKCRNSKTVSVLGLGENPIKSKANIEGSKIQALWIKSKTLTAQDCHNPVLCISYKQLQHTD